MIVASASECSLGDDGIFKVVASQVSSSVEEELSDDDLLLLPPEENQEAEGTYNRQRLVSFDLASILSDNDDTINPPTTEEERAKRPRCEQDGGMKQQQQEEEAETSRPSTRRKTNVDAVDSDQPTEQPKGDVWDEAIHRAFVKAVYEVGLKHSSPSVILDNMRSKTASVTSERVKSHLQKYRLNKTRGKEDFMREYDKWMAKAMAVCGGINKRSGSSRGFRSPATILELLQPWKLDAGSLAGFLSFSVLAEDNNCLKEDSSKTDSGSRQELEFLKGLTGAMPISFPQLTEEEKNSSLGKALIYVMGLFFALRDRHSEIRKISDSNKAGKSSNKSHRDSKEEDDGTAVNQKQESATVASHSKNKRNNGRTDSPHAESGLEQLAWVSRGRLGKRAYQQEPAERSARDIHPPVGYAPPASQAGGHTYQDGLAEPRAGVNSPFYPPNGGREEAPYYGPARHEAYAPYQQHDHNGYHDGQTSARTLSGEEHVMEGAAFHHQEYQYHRYAPTLDSRPWGVPPPDYRLLRGYQTRERSPNPTQDPADRAGYDHSDPHNGDDHAGH